MPQQHALDGGVVSARVEPDGFGHVFTFDQRQGILKAQNMRAIRLAPTGRRDDRGLRR
jgi:hypothetical protein